MATVKMRPFRTFTGSQVVAVTSRPVKYIVYHKPFCLIERMSELNYHHLHLFRAVAHDGNLTRTAARLNLSQSAISVQIRKLEARLRHALFERRGRQLHLTEAGRIALDHADAIFAVGDELVSTLRDTGRSLQVLRVGALATLSRNFQIDFLRPVLGQPDSEVILRSGSLAELLHGRRDQLLQIGDFADVGVDADYLRAQRRDLLFQSGRGLGMRDVVDHDIRTLPGQFQDDRQTDAAVAAGDDGHFSFETHATFLLKQWIA